MKLKIPLFKTVYHTAKDMLSSIFSIKKRKAFKYPVLTNFPSKKSSCIGFASGDIPPSFKEILSINYSMKLIFTNEEFDQILLSARNQNEIWIIDHSTSTEEAASHSGGRYGKGGDLLYRWGNPQVYHMGNWLDRKFFGQHDATWIESGYPGEGNILVFNNGIGRLDGFYSTVDEIIPPVDEYGNYIKSAESAYGPEDQIWMYTSEVPGQFGASSISGAERLQNGNTMICIGPAGRFFEVTWDLITVWIYDNPYPTSLTNDVFKIRSYSSDYPGLSNLF